MTHDPRGMDLADYIQELTQPHTHREPYTIRHGRLPIRQHHTTRVPSLVDQLETATRPATGETGAGGYASRPAAGLEAIDTLIHIDLEAARWVRDLGENDPGSTKACLLRLNGLAASAPPVTRREIAHDARRWWLHARIVTGWDSPAWRPDNTCPSCATRGSLRVRLGVQAALCIDCRATWTVETIGLLAEHIRAENNEDDTRGDGDALEGLG